MIKERTLSASVITCIYNTARLGNLMTLVASLRRQTLPPQQIIVVVDHNPALLAHLRGTMPDIVVIPNGGLRGASGSRNSGVAATLAEIVAFIDDDAIADPEWLERLARCYTDSSVMGVGGSTSPVWTAGKPAWFPAEFYWIVGCTYRGMPQKNAAVRNVIAANMSIRRDAFLSINGFRPGFGKVGGRARPEDTELCIRASQKWPHSRWLYEPAARVYHHAPAARATWSYFLQRCFHEGWGKADLATLIGIHDSLVVERSYIRTTLPLGVLMGVADLVIYGDLMGLVRAAAILCGLIATVAGFLSQWGIRQLIISKRQTSQKATTQ